MQTTHEIRSHWATRFGFIMAAAGSAVGLGNIWRFPYLAGEHGGALFILIYIALTFTVGISVMLAELVIGRMSQRNPVGAFARLKGGAWVLVGYFGVVAALLILPFYSVVGGWTLGYLAKTATGSLATADPGSLAGTFGAFTAAPEQQLFWHALFMGLTVAVVVGGVRGGIERASRIMMPLLYVILAVLVIRAVTLPGAEKGLTFFLAPDFSRFGPDVILSALGQMFFSLSLGMGAMITYGSYIERRGKLASSGGWVVLLDTSASLLAGLAVLPAVFAFGMNPGEGPGLTFVTLPAVFAQMPAGQTFGVLFFVLLAVAALTSSISLLEVITAYLIDEKGMRRLPASLGAGIVTFLIGVPVALSFGLLADVKPFGLTIFGLLDYVATKILLPAGAICIALFVAWAVWPRAAAEMVSEDGIQPRWVKSWRVVCGAIAPLLIAWILFSGL